MKLLAGWRASRSRRWLRTCALVGDKPHLSGKPSINVDGGQLRIGDRFRLASRPVASHLAVGPNALLHIGDDVGIGCGAAISAYQHVRIGDGTRIGPFVIIMDTNFHSAGDQSLQHDCRPVSIGNSCRIGSRVTITRGVSIGDGAEILAGSVVSTTIPSGVCAAGARARIIGRAGDASSRWESPAAMLPDILMTALGLESAPNLDSTPLPARLSTDAAMRGLLDVIENQLGLALDLSGAPRLETFSDIATIVLRNAWAKGPVAIPSTLRQQGGHPVKPLRPIEPST